MEIYFCKVLGKNMHEWIMTQYRQVENFGNPLSWVNFPWKLTLLGINHRAFKNIGLKW